MGRQSTKENKTLYQKCRENLGLTREKAAETMPALSAERIEKIENERIAPQPEDVLAMAERYGAPHLCNHYCSCECPIGKRYVPEIPMKDLSQIVLETLASLNSAQKEQERLIEITADGVIEGDEVSDFIRIQENLEKIAVAVESMQLWSEKMLAAGKIDRKVYDAIKAAKQ